MTQALTIRKTCEALGGADQPLSDDTVYRLIKRGDLDAFKVGTRTLVTVASLEAFIQRAPRLAAAA